MVKLSEIILSLSLVTLACSVALVNGSKRNLLVEVMQTECYRDTRVDSICYECGVVYEPEFSKVYFPCCHGEKEIRNHCMELYSEPRRAGGMWT